MCIEVSGFCKILGFESLGLGIGLGLLSGRRSPPLQGVQSLRAASLDLGSLVAVSS